MQKFITRSAVLSAFLSAMLLAAASAADAQQQDGDKATKPDEAPAEPGSASDFSDKKLESFAAAYVEINKIAQKHSEELKSAQGSDEARDVQKRVNSKMEKAIQKEGLSTEEFNQVVQAVKQDPQVREKVSKMLEQK